MKNILQITSFLILSMALLIGCSAHSEPISQTGFYFDTVITLTVYDPKDVSFLEDGLRMCETYENMLSKTMEGSDVWNINHAKGLPVTVSPETALLLETALQYSVMTDGAIDPTIAPLLDLWDFHSDTPKVPSESYLTDALSHIDYKEIIISQNEITLKDPDAMIDLGFIAKGFIADRLKEFLQANHVENALINLGGNIVTIGSKPDGTDYTIGIQRPFSPQGTYLTSVSVSDYSVVSSGVYERYFKENDILYHHILDPKTGYPVTNNLWGVTILAPTSMEADALSTTSFVLGLEKGLALINSLDDVEALFITSDLKLHYSDHFPVK